MAIVRDMWITGPAERSRNKLGKAFIADLYETWKRRGIEAIERAIDKQFGQYLKVIAMLVPKDVNLNMRPLDDLTDEQLLRRLQQVTELARPLLSAVFSTSRCQNLRN